MKKKILITAASVILLSQNVFADNCDDLVITWKSLYSTIQGKTYTKAQVKTVTTPDEWENAIINAYENLEDGVTLQIAGFNDNDYNLSKLKNYNVTISAKGYVTTDEISTIMYTFDYNPNYKIARAVDNYILFSRLDIEQKEVYDILWESTRKLTDDLSTDYEKEVAIHNFITDNFKYGPIDTSVVPQRAHSIQGFVIDGQGICEAYANTFYVMCKMAGLDVSIITGTTNNIDHMWNLIKLDGEYYHVDITSDDPAPDIPNRERYNYFNVSDNIISKTHSWERSDFPECNSDKYNYYTLNNYIVHNEQELKDFINTELNSGKTSFTFRTEDYAISSADIIKYYTTNKGFYTVSITGSYGKESTYNVTLK